MPGSLVTLIIPCYNEIDGLPQLMRRLTAMQAAGEMAGWEVLFVNDGSKDGTREALNLTGMGGWLAGTEIERGPA